MQVNEEMASNLKKLLMLPLVMLCIGMSMIIAGLCLLGAILYLMNKQRLSSTTVRISFADKLYVFFFRFGSALQRNLKIISINVRFTEQRDGEDGRRRDAREKGGNDVHGQNKCQ